MKFWTKAKLLAVAAVALLGAPTASAQLVSYDGTNSVSFAPEALVSPAITGIVAAITAGTAVFIIFVGVRWVLKAIKLIRG